MARLPILVATLVAGALGAATTPAFADTITLRADEWCPYNCAPDSDRPGYAIEVAQEIFAKAGHVIDYKIMPWTRALAECQKGTIAAVFGTYPDESPDFVFPAEAGGTSNNAVLVRKGNPWRYKGVASLDDLKIGVVQGYVYSGEIGSYLDEKGKNKSKKNNIFPVGGDTAGELNLKKLAAGRIDATIDAEAVLIHKIKMLGIAEKVEFAGSADVLPVYLAFSPALPKSKDYAELFSQGIAEMRASGRLKQILDRYSLKDWK
jgi:polar amino acid transport system substrate-binding protein